MPTETDKAEQMWVEARDKDRLEQLGAREHRRPRQQLTAIIDEACQRRNLDPQTLKPLNKRAS